MPFIFIVVGVGLLVIAIRGTQKTAFGLLQSEFTGSGNFVSWSLALFLLGAAGYVPVVRPITRALMLLVLLVLVLKKGGGFFDQFNNQIKNPIAPPMPTANQTGMNNPATNTGVYQPFASPLPSAGSPLSTDGSQKGPPILPPFQWGSGPINSPYTTGNVYNQSGQLIGSTNPGSYIDSGQWGS